MWKPPTILFLLIKALFAADVNSHLVTTQVVEESLDKFNFIIIHLNNIFNFLLLISSVTVMMCEGIYFLLRTTVT